MAREYFRSRADRDSKKLVDLVFYLVIVVLVFVAFVILMNIMRTNYNKAVANCINNTSYTESYCKFLAK